MIHAIQNTLGVKKARPSQKHQLLLFSACDHAKGVISARSQGLLRLNHFMDAAIYNRANKQ